MNDPVKSNEGAVAGSSPVPCSLFVIRGEINGAMTYVQKEGEEYVAKPSLVKIYGATLFVHRGDAKKSTRQDAARNCCPDGDRGIVSSEHRNDAMTPAPLISAAPPLFPAAGNTKIHAPHERP